MVEREEPARTGVERGDPAHAGVKAGRLVGLLTAALAVASLLQSRGSFYRVADAMVGVAGVDSGVPVAVLFWGNVALAASARYALCYVVGSLVGVLYDWLDRPSMPVLGVVVLLVGAGDGALALADSGSLLIGMGYAIAWLCYLPAFARLYDRDADTGPSGPRRLGRS